MPALSAATLRHVWMSASALSNNCVPAAPERGTGISLIFSILLLVISVRQTLLDLSPRPGHDYVGSAIFGLHMPVWSVFIAVALLLGFAVRLALFGGPRSASENDGLDNSPVGSGAHRLCRLHLRDQFHFRRRAMRDGRMPHFRLPTAATNSGLNGAVAIYGEPISPLSPCWYKTGDAIHVFQSGSIRNNTNVAIVRRAELHGQRNVSNQRQ